MPPSMERLIREWDGFAVVSRYHRATGSWIFIALHDATFGSPCGGTRLKHYPEPVAGLRDAMRLARGMTHKWAAIEFDSGGGKAVLAVPERLEPEDRRSLLLEYGRLVQEMGGLFATGRDLGTTDDDMRVLAEVTAYVHGVDRQTGETCDPGPYTAHGVDAAIRATLAAVFGSSDPTGKTVLVQGLGGVGRPLAYRLSRAGASLLLSDIDEKHAEGLAEELGARTVAPDDVYDTPCDLYAPCALGATLDETTIPRLRCRAVAGSANNQLAEDRDASRLHERGILYAPDFIANGGGALAFGLIHRGETDEATIATRLDGIAGTLGDVYAEAARLDRSPQRVAIDRIEAALAREG